MRSDHIGQIELSTESGDKNQTSVSMNKEEINKFDFIKGIPSTRWQLAIRLDPKYNQSLFIEGLTKALIIWILLTTLIYAFYRQQKNASKKIIK
jgi:ATP-dependent Zn protease